MTQVISVITKDYALLASDRRLTIGEGPRLGDLCDDDACKLVSICNICGIGYTGLATIEGSATHEWIAKTLASENCDPSAAAKVLQDHAARAFSRAKLSVKVRQEFLIAGWGLFQGLPGFHPYMRLVSNVRDDSGRPLPQPVDSFTNLLKVLVGDQSLFCWGIGQPIRPDRGPQLERNLERLVKREIGPSAALRFLVNEIVNTSVFDKTVGSKVLGFCIPKEAVERQVRTGQSFMLAKQPDRDVVTFTYFEPRFSELRQYGPTVVCGENAYTDVATENDPAREFQSAAIKILALPKAKQ